ncbi:nucleotide pyrophosphohydrolase [Rickettsiella endosymbiont of Dermanyssus gallinae]|uniref:nucleotide pyrophosphohydrolase n=1 Tax=Rickettsiella endosymbiont of Dermanyssus gallinae TaxID=2856608 RepID=UPI001FECB041|nr:nucleotide pyrophosphohydrolase [Rickettsiella endosymbiont of Dermanyssus gallinae]
MKDIIDVDKLKEKLAEFAKVREWERFHSPKNLSMAVAGEVGELLEIFQWYTEQESRCVKNDPLVKERVSHELADIVLYVTRIADQLDIDLNTAILNKLAINNSKYPASKVKGSAKKYTEYNPQ